MAIKNVETTVDNAVWISLTDRCELIHSFDLSWDDAAELHKRLEVALYGSDITGRSE